MFRLYIYNVFLREISICVLFCICLSSIALCGTPEISSCRPLLCSSLPGKLICLSLLKLPALSLQFRVSTRLYEFQFPAPWPENSFQAVSEIK